MDPNYTLGRGKLYLDKFLPGTKTTTGERYIGNTPDMTLQQEAQTLDHFNSDEGIKEKDDSIILQIDRSAQVSFDDIQIDNLALFFLGESSVVEEAAEVGPIEFGIPLPTHDRHFQIGVSAERPSGERRITIGDVTQGVTVFVAGTDYIKDDELGRIYIPVGSAIDPVEPLTVEYARRASERAQIISSSQPAVECAARFIAYNPKGKNLDHFFPFVRITPNGDFPLKGDEWQQGSLNIEILKRDANTAAHYIDGRAVAG